MKTMLSVVIAAAFAATGLNVAAQTKDPTTKDGGAVADKAGTSVKRKEVKDKPKGGPVPKVEKRAKKAKAAPSDVSTKGGGGVTSKDGAVNKK